MAVVTLTIDGREVKAESGMTLLEAAQGVGVDIPRLCYHPDLSIVGACRFCVVEVEKARTLVASCTTPVAEGMVVKTRSPRVITARKTILELMLANHPRDCLVCEKSGECALQDYAYEYGVRGETFSGETHDFEIEDENPFIIRDYNKCIVCGRCVRVCDEIQGRNAVDYAYRGFDTKITTAFDRGLADSPCVFCGNCLEYCPVGAIMPKSRQGKGRSWQIERTRTVCSYCGVGCEMYLEAIDGKLVSTSGADGGANHGLLCVKGRFGNDYVQSEDRLTVPLVRKDGELVESTWEEAMDLVARRLQETVKAHGPEAVGGLASAKCTNEENFAMQRLIRSMGSNNVDHCARLCHASTVAGLAIAFGSGAMTNSIDEIENAKAIFIIGSNTTESHPVIGVRVKQAVAKGARLIVADPRNIELASLADVYMRQRPGTDVALLNGMMKVILDEGLHDRDFINDRTEGFEELKKILEKYTPEYVSEITGVPAEDIREAARLYATAETGSILYAMGITQHTTGTDNVLSVANLAMLTGNVGKENAGVNPLRGQNNVQGACDMGALPNVLPGYQRLADEKVLARFEEAWGTKLNPQPGLTVVEMMHSPDLRALYIMGENPMLSDPDLNHVEEKLRSLDFLVVQDIFLTETAKLADVVLPGSAFAEKDGTFTNTERRVQRVRKAVEAPGDARPDWWIVSEVARRMGFDFGYRSPEDILAEINSLVPSYGGITWERVSRRGLQWPCPDESHPGTRFLHQGQFTRGKGLFSAIEFRPPAEEPDDEYPLVLTTGRMLYHFHTGSMSRRSKGLDEIQKTAYLEIHPATALELGVGDGDWVEVASRRGRILVQTYLTEGIGRDVVFMPFHFAEAAANVLTNAALDPVAKIPEFKVCAVKVMKAGKSSLAQSS